MFSSLRLTDGASSHHSRLTRHADVPPAVVGVSNSLFEFLREGDSAPLRDVTNHQIAASSA
jgi:hypothetical protein